MGVILTTYQLVGAYREGCIHERNWLPFEHLLNGPTFMGWFQLGGGIKHLVGLYLEFSCCNWKLARGYFS